MKLGAYTACLHDKPLPEALKTLASLGLESAEVNSGGFLPPVHLPIDDLRSSEQARQDYLGEFEAAGVTLTALNCNGNPLHPHPTEGPRQAQDILTKVPSKEPTTAKPEPAPAEQPPPTGRSTGPLRRIRPRRAAR